MTKEEAARILDPSTTRESLAKYSYEESVQVTEEACRIAAQELRKNADHFREATKMVPLTLEQLREMEGKPVWVERNEKPHDGKWFIVSHADIKNPDKTLYTKEGVTYSNYGVYFTAYAYPPVHIEWEAWKGCPWCKAEYTILDDDFGQPVHPNMVKFCWHCGRPLTHEAWEALEKRLRG